MKLTTIIREAGFNPCVFPKCSQIPITVYDRKDRETMEEDLHFSKKLFADNANSATSFFNFITSLETNPVESINVKIDEFSVIVFYKTPQAIIFQRNSLNPMDRE